MVYALRVYLRHQNTCMEQKAYWNKWLDKWFYVLVLVGIAINATGLFITILDSDGTLYASIAKTIAQTGDFVNLKVQGKDWLDKPHFPFWMAAISYKIFGINTFAYKFPALLFWAMGLVYTYRLALSIYGKGVARIAALIYVTAAHLVISNNDVRAEPYLTGLIIGSIYHYYKATSSKIGFHLLVGSLWAACAIMTKGPFVLITIAAGFVVDWAIKGEWRQFFHYRWLLAIVLVAIFIIPELYCLYAQFDLHPEKTVFDRTGVSGIRFFFWDSQFGRFFNTGPIKGSGDPFFYFHTLLWAFLPWSLLLYTAIFWKIRNAGNRTMPREFITLGAAGATFIVFSLSKFQLPHYSNILFPFFAILTAQYLYEIRKEKAMNIIKWVQHTICVLVLLIIIALIIFYQPPHLTGIIIWLVVVMLFTLLLFRKNNISNVIGRSFLAVVGVYGFLNIFFYPAIMEYQSGSKAAFYSNAHFTGKPATMFHNNSYSYTFYSTAPVYFWSDEELQQQAAKHPVIVYTAAGNIDTLVKQGYHVSPVTTFPEFHASQLTGTFINHATRSRELKDFVVTEISR